jgi:hypothetical protein
MVRVLGFVIVTLFVLPTVAQVSDPIRDRRRGISDRFELHLGGWVKSFNSRTRADSEHGPGTGIELEELLGLESSRSDVRLDGSYRFARRHRIVFGFTRFKRESLVTLDEQIRFEDHIYDVGAEVDSAFATAIFKTAYNYSFVNNGKIDGGMSFGLSTFRIGLKLAGEARIIDESGGGAEIAFASEEEDFYAPVPMFGAHVDYTIRPGLFVRSSFELFDLSVQDLDVRVLDWKATLDWYPWQHWGFGVGYDLIDMRYADNDPPAFVVDYAFDGLLVYVSYAR